MVFVALFSVIFGGPHCIGWHFEFSTNPEQTLLASYLIGYQRLYLSSLPQSTFFCQPETSILAEKSNAL